MDATEGEGIKASEGLKRVGIHYHPPPRHRKEGEQQREETEEDMAKVRGKYGLRGKKDSASPWVIGFGALLGITVFLLVLLALGIVSLPIHSDAPEIHAFDHHGVQEHDREDLGKRNDQWTETLSWEPRATLYHNFLSKEECEYLIDLAKSHLARSSVVDSTTGGSKDSSVRTSTGTFLRRGQDKFVRAIEKRIADFTFLPVENQEGLQILRYDVGQKYDAHHDYFHDEFNTKNGGQRIATVLMYLNDVEEGGETVFPNAKANASSLPYYNELSECGKTGLSVKPKTGDALLFWSLKPDATLDPLSLHGACPVIKGSKWSAPKWIRANAYNAY